MVLAPPCEAAGSEVVVIGLWALLDRYRKSPTPSLLTSVAWSSVKVGEEMSLMREGKIFPLCFRD